MALTLAKGTDRLNHPYGVDNGGFGAYLYLEQWSGALPAQTWDDLCDNDLRGLSNAFYLRANDPHHHL